MRAKTRSNSTQTGKLLPTAVPGPRAQGSTAGFPSLLPPSDCAVMKHPAGIPTGTRDIRDIGQNTTRRPVAIQIHGGRPAHARLLAKFPTGWATARPAEKTPAPGDPALDPAPAALHTQLRGPRHGGARRVGGHRGLQIVLPAGPVCGHRAGTQPPARATRGTPLPPLGVLQASFGPLTLTMTDKQSAQATSRLPPPTSLAAHRPFGVCAHGPPVNPVVAGANVGHRETLADVRGDPATVTHATATLRMRPPGHRSIPQSIVRNTVAGVPRIAILVRTSGGLFNHTGEHGGDISRAVLTTGVRASVPQASPGHQET